MLKALWVFPLLLSVGLSVPSGLIEKYLQQSVRGGRIAGGTEAARNQFPYQVLFFIYTSDGQSICGGSILSANFVLSAAHCFVSFSSADLLAGLHNIELDDPGYELEIFPTDVTLHAQYNRNTQLNDVAVARTSRRPIPLGATMAAVTLVPRSWATTELTGTMGRIAGWGRTTDTNNEISASLRFIDAAIISNAECARTFGTVITAGNICLSGANARSTCQGDSGGPLTVTNAGKQLQVGIVSFGSDTGCQKGYPTAFARITSFHTWIQSSTGITIS